MLVACHFCRIDAVFISTRLFLWNVRLAHRLARWASHCHQPQAAKDSTRYKTCSTMRCLWYPSSLLPVVQKWTATAEHDKRHTAGKEERRWRWSVYLPVIPLCNSLKNVVNISLLVQRHEQCDLLYLQIEHATAEYSGTYLCSLSNTLGERWTEPVDVDIGKLKVKPKTKISPVIPVFSQFQHCILSHSFTFSITNKRCQGEK